MFYRILIKSLIWKSSEFGMTIILGGAKVGRGALSGQSPPCMYSMSVARLPVLKLDGTCMT